MSPEQFEVFLRQRSIAYTKQRGSKGSEFKIACPFCPKTAENKWGTAKSLSVNVEHNMFRCWRCPASGTAYALFKDPSFKVTTRSKPEVKKAKCATVVPGKLLPLLSLPDDHMAIRYICKRGFDPAELDRVYGVRFCSAGISFAQGRITTTNTLIFPVWMNKTVVGWQSRLLFDPDTIPESDYPLWGFYKEDSGTYFVPPKYFTSPGFEKGRVLYNFDIARSYPLVVIVEGVFDAFSVGPAAVCLFGKNIAQQQLDLIKQYWRHVVILLDPDADKDAKKLQLSLATSCDTLQVSLTDYSDPGKAPRSEIWRQISVAAKSRDISKAFANEVRVISECVA